MSPVLDAPLAPDPPSISEASEILRLYATARQSHRDGRLDEAERLYRQVMARAPRHAGATHMLGLLAGQAGQYEAAAGLIRAAIALDGAVPAFHLNLGHALAALGRPAEAAEAWQAALRLQPNAADAWFGLGNALLELGDFEAAISAFRTVLRLRPEDAEACSNLGAALGRAGRFEEAAVASREAVRLRPDCAKAFNNLATVLLRLARPGEALAAAREAVRVAPGYARGHTTLGLVLQKLGRLDEALAAAREAARLQPGHAETQANLGAILHKLGRFEESVAFSREALRLQPDYPEALSNLGAALGGAGRFAESVQACRQAIRQRPDHAEAWSNLGAALEQLGRFDEAEAASREAVRLAPFHANAQANLGTVLQKLGRFEEAIPPCREAVRLAPDLIDARANLGTALAQAGHLAEAEGVCRETVRRAPEHIDAHFNLGMLLLTRGDMKGGWQEYEWRWRTRTLAPTRADFACPQWRGEAGEGTLLIHAEQGLGDTLQFCRYASFAAARGWRVLLLVPRPLVRLLGSLAGVAGIVAEGEALPPCDRHCPMMSLPLALGTRVETIPGETPYLAADPGEVASWRGRLDALCGPGLRVGVAWAGNPRRHSPTAEAVDRRRSVAPELLAPLLATPCVHFISLQKDGPAAPAAFPLIDLMPEMGDFADTAALVAGLDLVVTVDTAMVHLAGALGRKTWLLDRFDHCWRWLGDRRDSPWYPGLRLYRQSQPGAWESVIAEMARDLAAAYRRA